MITTCGPPPPCRVWSWSQIQWFFLPLPLDHSWTRPGISLLQAQTVSAKQGPLPGQVAVCRHRTITHNPVLVNPESFMEASRSAGALCGHIFSCLFNKMLMSQRVTHQHSGHITMACRSGKSHDKNYPHGQIPPPLAYPYLPTPPPPYPQNVDKYIYIFNPYLTTTMTPVMKILI